MPLGSLIAAAKMPSPWRVGNEVLYKLCRTRPAHKDAADVIAKIWLIGRSYAAAIERRKNKSDENDNFYVNAVAPAVIASSIDEWLKQARQHDKPSINSLTTLLQVHHRTTQLFNDISGLEKRSLASKYLHFHVPQLFYIYDTRAVEALRLLGGLVCRAGRGTVETDNEYRKFAEKCLSLQQHVKEQYGVSLSPRELDNLLLQVHQQKPNERCAMKPRSVGEFKR
ncbi:MAG: hypothetical protein LM517_03180 [Nitrosomonas sp.]|nr:hypothetical protein [Nitrosomonas sp.]